MRLYDAAVSAIVKVTQQTARALLQLRGDVAGRALAELLVRRYGSLEDAERTEFFGFLLDELGADAQLLTAAIEVWTTDPSQTNAVELHQAAESSRIALFRAINTTPGGIEMLLHMRTELMSRRQTEPRLRPVENDLVFLLRSWFNRGFLELRQLDWSTPAHVLEKLIKYEAVHEIRSWDDLRRRLDGDRRCFGFFHPALPNEPIIFVEVALTKGMASSIQSVIDAPSPVTTNGSITDVADVDTAIFYSITNCQTGLRGISFGSFLIKRVSTRLAEELPQVTAFATLSPVPGLAAWIADSHPDTDLADTERLTQLAAAYLIGARSRGLPADPVARFHLRNGARLERLNPGGDRSPRGMEQSHGMLVNYLYSGQELAANHDSLVLDGRVVAAEAIIELAATVGVDCDRLAARATR